MWMYLPQAVSLPPELGIEQDLFRRIHIVEDIAWEPADVTCGVAGPSSHAIPLPSRQVRRGKTGPFLCRIARNRHHPPSELGLGCRNPAHQEVSA